METCSLRQGAHLLCEACWEHSLGNRSKTLGTVPGPPPLSAQQLPRLPPPGALGILVAPSLNL